MKSETRSEDVFHVARAFLSPRAGLIWIAYPSHGLRRGLHYFAASRLGFTSFPSKACLKACPDEKLSSTRAPSYCFTCSDFESWNVTADSAGSSTSLFP